VVQQTCLFSGCFYDSKIIEYNQTFLKYYQKYDTLQYSIYLSSQFCSAVGGFSVVSLTSVQSGLLGFGGIIAIDCEHLDIVAIAKHGLLAPGIINLAVKLTCVK
jgi:hypothetical protein